MEMGVQIKNVWGGAAGQYEEEGRTEWVVQKDGTEGKSKTQMDKEDGCQEGRTNKLFRCC